MKPAARGSVKLYRSEALGASDLRLVTFQEADGLFAFEVVRPDGTFARARIGRKLAPCRDGGYKTRGEALRAGREWSTAAS